MSLLQSSDNESDDNPFLGESDEECEEASSASNSNDVGPILFKRKESFWREIPELKMGTSSDRAEALCKLPYWRRLCPLLHVDDPAMVELATSTVMHFDPELIDEYRNRMLVDGYFNISAGTHLPWSVNIEHIASGIKTLAEHGWPPSFILMYDEPWVLTHQVQELVRMCTGNALIMDFATFFVGSGIDASGTTTNGTSGARENTSGWPPHRDRSSDTSTTAFRSDGLPKYSTTWIPLTTASPTNSCLYVIPRTYDPGYHQGDNGKNPLEVIFKDPAAYQYIRALPCDAGSLLHFSHRLLHWGSAAGTAARLSLRLLLICARGHVAVA
eukprot:m.929546 g.929546  ORF g.929546 m.929546 type:complete len:328 (+) comp23781_c0_seq42:237-1220(+)